MSDRLQVVIDRFNAHRDRGLASAPALCATCSDVLSLPGAGILLLDRTGAHTSLWVSDPVMESVEELQSLVGAGPCVEAGTSGTPAIEPDLARARADRWLGFAEPAVAAGAGAVFGFALQVGGARIGALNLYRGHAGALSDVQHADALVLAEVATNVILAELAGATPELMTIELRDVGLGHHQVHQAAGMISVQIGSSIGDAMVRLRAHAYASGETLRAVAAEVVARRRRFEPDEHL